jgi:hypothetical protein
MRLLTRHRRTFHELRDGNRRMSGFCAPFGKGGLAPHVTEDGLPVNAVGISRLVVLIEPLAIGAGAVGCR